MTGSSFVADSSFAVNLLPQKNTALHRILCCNIRVALPEDEAAGHGWPQRKALCAKVLHQYKPDIICLQEVLRIQNEDLKKAFPGFVSFGFEGPEMDTGDNTYQGIAKNPIFFSGKRYELLSSGGYWLSETPLIAGSKSWDTARARNANWVRLRDKATGKDFRISNLHLDHESQFAREEQIKLVLSEAGQYHPQYPQILTGDFNSNPSNNVYALVTSGGWQDTYVQTNPDAESEPTFHGFKGANYERKEDAARIDFIFTLGKVKPAHSEIVKDHEEELYPSDHYFVLADVAVG